MRNKRRRAGHSMSNSRPGLVFDAASGLLDRLDVDGYRHFVAYDRAAGLQRHVNVDPEVVAVQHDRRLEAGDLAVAHAGTDTVELQFEGDRLGDAFEGEFTVEDVVVAFGLHGGGGEPRGGVCLDVEEVG